ncbi:MAG: type II secretion system ATPase GspE [Deltaproteobacteria bacterium]|nr:type II secretion system ATPase GspE [Deltaproteobacteria bacterium]
MVGRSLVSPASVENHRCQVSGVSEQRQRDPVQGQTLEAILLRDTALSRDQLELAQRESEQRGCTVADVIKEDGLLSEEELLRAMAAHLAVEYVAIVDPDDVDGELVAHVPINYAKTHLLLPLHRGEDALRLLMADPSAVFAIDDIRTIFDAEVSPVLATRDLVLETINKVYAKHTSAVDLEENDDFQGDSEELADIIDATDEAPIIRWVNSLIFQAVKERASDIHIEPRERDVVVRYRIDGVLYEARKANRNYASSIAARVKIMAGLNIAEKRLPQDGRIRRRIAGKDIDMRVATAPTARGERITIRLLDKSAVLLNLGEIGLAPDQLMALNELIHRPHGILLVTGPTGSGKTTTLYGALSSINNADKNILTIEDPVEYQLEGISQTQVNAKIDLTFAGGLRSFLRHDPDVIMVGEIRDHETAEIAIQASLTGHLVFSTVHTNDAAGAITRLIEMDVEPFLVASSLIGMVAQRLVRKVCPDCMTLRPPTEADLLGLGLTRQQFNALGERDFGLRDERRPRPPAGMAYVSEGCANCLNTGYAGRLGIYELLVMSDEVRALVLKHTDTTTIKRLAVEQGMRTLRADGVQKIVSGMTTIEEVMRVTQEDSR